MTYKTGEVPQIGDSVMGMIDDKPARGVVISARSDGSILLQRRAPYQGPQVPLQHDNDEVNSEDFSLIYRHKKTEVEAPPAKKAKKK